MCIWNGLPTDKSFNNYQLLRSEDGQKWTIIHSNTINAHTAFSFIDKNASKGVNLYQVRLQDLNGGNVYSKIVSVDLSQLKNDVKVYPNPAQDVLYIEGVTSAIEVLIYNVFGQLMDRYNLNQNAQLDLKKYPAGQYILKLYTVIRISLLNK